MRAFLSEVRAYLAAPITQPRIILVAGFCWVGAVAFITMQTVRTRHIVLAYVGKVIFAFFVVGLAWIVVHSLYVAALHFAYRRHLR